MDRNDLPHVLGAKDVAKLLRVSYRVALDIMDAEDFPLKWVGQRKMVSREAFFRWMEGEHYKAN